MMLLVAVDEALPNGKQNILNKGKSRSCTGRRMDQQLKNSRAASLKMALELHDIYLTGTPQLCSIDVVGR